jgi:ATP-binding cassette, subfamily B, bacterial
MVRPVKARIRVPYLHRWTEALALAQVRRSLWPSAIGSFVAGFAEAGLLVLVTFVAVSFTDGSETIMLWGIRFRLGDALWAAGGLLLLKTALQFLVNRRNASIAAVVQVKTRARLMRAFFSAEWKEKSAQTVGDLQELASNYVTRTSLLMLSLSALLTASLSLSAFLAASMLVSPATTVGVIVVSALVLACLRPINAAARRLIALEANMSRSYAGLVAEASQVARDIETFHVGDKVHEPLDKIAHSASTAFRSSRLRLAMVPSIYQAVIFGFALLGLAFAMGQVAVGSLASIGAVVLLMLRSLSSAQQVISRAQQVDEKGVYLTSILEAVEHFERAAMDDGIATPLKVTPIVMDGVTFEYPRTERTALEVVALSIEEGDSLGVVGRSGAGKSTLVQLLLRLQRPTAGLITAGGVPLGQIDRAWWAKRVAFVPQEPHLIGGTIAENVAFYRAIDEGQIRRALKRAQLLDEVERLPLGIHTPLGGESGTLSGGQRQRVALARALAGEPQVILLDEPTSALDPVSERLISEMLKELRGTVTLIIVAHRLETLASCDRVLVLAGGAVAEVGSPELLMQQGGYFSDAFGNENGRPSSGFDEPGAIVSPRLMAPEV